MSKKLVTVARMRKLLFVTGTRAISGSLSHLLRQHVIKVDVTFWVTGMHMLERYGLTKIEVQRLPGVSVSEFANQDGTEAQDLILANTVIGFSKSLSKVTNQIL